MESPSILIWILLIAGLGLILILLNRRMTSGRDRSRFGRKRRHDRDIATRGHDETIKPPPPPPPDDHTTDTDSSNAKFQDANLKEEGAQPPQSVIVHAETKDEVMCSAYAPAQMPAGGDYMVQVWLHLPQQAEDVEQRAKMQDDTASQRAKSYLTARLEHGDNVQVILRCNGVEIDEPEQYAIWRGRPENISFFIMVPEELTKGALFFTVEVFHESMPIGKMKFRVSTAASTENKPAPAVVDADQYEHAFVSYASQDRDAVLARVQGLKAARKYRIFQDVLVLEQGDQWEPRLHEEINKCDVFFLFWSQHAKASEWVKKEFVLALQRKHNDDKAPPRIHPIPLEHPIVKPWEDLKAELGKYHLNDQTLYFMSGQATPSGQVE